MEAIDCLEEFKGTVEYKDSVEYEGKITLDVIHNYTNKVEQLLVTNNSDEIVQRKVYHILIEFLQNISKYSAFHKYEDDMATGYGRVFFGLRDESFDVITCNKVRKKDEKRIIEIIDHVNSLDKKGLKELHVKQLKNSEFNEKQGAGLGFISVKKRNKQKLEYNFIDWENDEIYFLLKINVIDIPVVSH